MTTTNTGDKDGDKVTQVSADVASWAVGRASRAAGHPRATMPTFWTILKPSPVA